MTRQTNPTITAFESSPDKGAGLARDTRVRWACEEDCQRYDVRFVSFKYWSDAERSARTS